MKSINRWDGWKTACVALFFCVATATSAPAQTFTTLVNFDGTNGVHPNGYLVQGTDGNFYGTTQNGGNDPDASGTVFRLTPGGTLATLYNFCAGGSQQACADGSLPVGGMIRGADGNFYGTTAAGGSYVGNGCLENGCGTIFKITAAGELTILHRFSGPPDDGYLPNGPLTQGPYGNFYGTTSFGGAHNRGAIFKMTPDGTVTLLFSFDIPPQGWYPTFGLIQGTDGNLYGAAGGGNLSGPCETLDGCGTIFKIAPTGTLTTLHQFSGWDGSRPFMPIQGNDGNLYGTTQYQGRTANNCATNGCGTVFQMGTGGKLATLYRFVSSWPEGINPAGPLIQSNDGNFYGTTNAGLEQTGQPCPDGCGTIFRITPAGTTTTLYTTPGDAPGEYDGGLVQGTDGALYGTMIGAGNSGQGIVYKFSVGLVPFVEAQINSGIVGAEVIILGNKLTGTTAVSFNGTPATFTVPADTYLTASVPVGAGTGNIEVTTPSGVLSSNRKFRVTPQIASFSPTSGAPGTTVVISGESLTQTTAVSLACKTEMPFTVNSDTQITVTIPSGAITGQIGIQTDGGHAESTANFTVTTPE